MQEKIETNLKMKLRIQCRSSFQIVSKLISNKKHFHSHQLVKILNRWSKNVADSRSFNFCGIWNSEAGNRDADVGMEVGCVAKVDEDSLVLVLRDAFWFDDQLPFYAIASNRCLCNDHNRYVTNFGRTNHERNRDATLRLYHDRLRPCAFNGTLRPFSIVDDVNELEFFLGVEQRYYCGQIIFQIVENDHRNRDDFAALDRIRQVCGHEEVLKNSQLRRLLRQSESGFGVDGKSCDDPRSYRVRNFLGDCFVRRSVDKLGKLKVELFETNFRQNLESKSKLSKIHVSGNIFLISIGFCFVFGAFLDFGVSSKLYESPS